MYPHRPVGKSPENLLPQTNILNWFASWCFFLYWFLCHGSICRMPNAANKLLTLTIVIPVYNEEHHLKECLDSVAAQTVQPIQVIVVNNNSTDASVAIAKRYKFVTLLHVKRQGQVFAQARGFAKAKGDIIGRIDGDSILSGDWCARVINHFTENPTTVAVSGRAEPYDIKLARVAKAIFLFYQLIISKLFAGGPLMWGANCAFRVSVWKKIKHKLTFRRDIWEDYDMSFLLREFGRIDHLKDLIIGCSFRAVDISFSKQLNYQMREAKTYWLHKPWRTPFIVLVVITKIIFIYPLTVLDTKILRKLIR